MANSADPDQLASEEANWSGATLFAKAGYIWVQQDKGKLMTMSTLLGHFVVSQREGEKWLVEEREERNKGGRRKMLMTAQKQKKH